MAILALHHELTVLEHQLGKEKVRFTRAIGRSQRRCVIGCRWTCCVGLGCWCVWKLCWTGIATWSHAATLPCFGRSARDDRLR